jgi:hypothetical protein
MPSEVIEIKSRVPLNGFTTKPATPLTVPLKNPKNPPFFVSSIGCYTTPVMPDPTELRADLNPKLRP